MKTKNLILILAALFPFLSGCSSEKPMEEKPQATNFHTEIEANYAIFPAEAESYMDTGIDERFTPTKEEIRSAIPTINNFLKVQEEKGEIMSLEKYKGQIFGYRDVNKDQIIWINYFCDTVDQDWTKNPILVMDGGNCYFELKMNLDSGEINDFRTNGYA